MVNKGLVKNVKINSDLLKRINTLIQEKMAEQIEKKNPLYEQILNDFIKIEREKSRAGSGDDLFYEQQIEDYINKQRRFWITFIDFVYSKFTEGVRKSIDELDIPNNLNASGMKIELKNLKQRLGL